MTFMICDFELTPKEYLSDEDFCAALTAQSPTTRDIMSFNYTEVNKSIS